MRPIDADRALEIVRDQGIAHPNACHLTNYATLILREAPTIDVAPVKHGRWVDNHCTACGMMPMGDEMWKLCDFEPPRFEKFMDYCPTCGAKMDGGAGNGC